MFAACVFPVHVWSIVNVLREVPAWVLRLSSWELVGVIAYTQAFALLESVLISLVLILLSVILPGRFFKDRLVAQSSVLVLVTSGWAIAAHYNDEIIRLWGMRQFLLWSAVYLASIGVVYVLIHRYKRLESLLRALVERVSVLSYLYVFLDFLSVLVVFARNIVGVFG